MDAKVEAALLSIVLDVLGRTGMLNEVIEISLVGDGLEYELVRSELSKSI